MCDLCHSLDVCDIQLRIADRLCKNGSGLRHDRLLESIRGVFLNIGCGDPVCLKLIQKFYRSTIKSCRCHNMITISKNVHQCHGQCCHSGGTRYTSDSAFQFRHPLLEGFDRRIVDPRVGVACAFVCEDLLQLLCCIVTECTGLVDRNLCRAVRIAVLASMKQSCVKTVFFHSCAPLFSFAVLMVLLYTYKHTMSIGNVCFFQIFSFFCFQLSEHIKKAAEHILLF